MLLSQMTTPLHSIRFHIAFTLQQLGRNGEEKEELDTLLKIYLEFP